MFPTTAWTHIRSAGASDPRALEEFAVRYRDAVRGYLRSRGCSDTDADDLLQDVFVRLLDGKVLSRADAGRGRFRHLLLAVTRHSLLDHHRRRSVRDRGVVPIEESPVELEDPRPDDDFDRAWLRQLTEHAMVALRTESPKAYELLRRHLNEERVDRNKLWAARKKLAAGLRREIANTCGSPEESQEEIAHLARLLGGKL